MDRQYTFAASEQPLLPGAPYTPMHPLSRRLGYAAIGTIAGIGSTLGNGLVNVNYNTIAGSMGLYAFEAALLPAIYVAFNVSANLMLVKGRIQFGVPAITHGLLLVYAAMAALQLVLPGLATAILVRAASGMAGAGLITFSLFNWLQVMPPKRRPWALVLGISIPQLGLPLARLFPVELLAQQGWQAVHLTELAIALVLLGVSLALPLPPSEKTKVCGRCDVLTFCLILLGMLALGTVLGEGRLLWWTDTPWLGWVLAFSVVAFAAAAIVEQGRTLPVLQLRWLSSLDIVRFAGVALLVRLALAEQTYGAVGLLTSGGLSNDQLRWLFVAVSIAMLLGMGVVILTLAEKRLIWLIVTAALVIAAGAFLDTNATNVTRPPQLYLSQCLIAFGTTLFVGPSLVYGFLRMLQRGPDHFVSFIVLFSSTQNLGGLAGASLLGSYQVMAAKFHAAALSEHLTGFDPQVVARIQAGSGGIAGAIPDPTLQSTEGVALLGQALTREANILAYNDVFCFVGILALLTAGYLAYHGIARLLRRPAEAAP
jgi:hypothetical protein